jgi:NADH-quinone oxidoreductase subunit G
MPNLTIDGRQIEVAAGTRIIEACKQVGVVVPHFCYHPGLSVAGNCRMCMVEIEMNGRSRVAASCVEPVAEGMIIRTATDEVRDTRQGVMEFLLLNHPIDCPYCDCAGECKLQDYYMDWGNIQEGSRRDTEQVHKPKRQEIGPHVMLDSERCVMCTRCIRFTEEVTGTCELGMAERGTHNVVHLAEGKTLDNDYSGNVVDICPVGALTDRSFRFQRRVWFLNKVDTICTGCSRGCNMELHFDLKRDYKNEASGRRVIRYKPRYNEEINQWWLCDRGRYDTDKVDFGRLTEPLVRRSGDIQPTSWDDALAEAARLLGDFAKRHPEQLALLYSPDQSNESLLAAREVLFKGLKLQHADFNLDSDPAGQEDEMLMKADLHPNRKACELLGLKKGAIPAGQLVEAIDDGRIKALVCFRWDLPTLLGDRADELLEKLRLLIVLGTHETNWHGRSDLQLPVAVFAEEAGTMTNFEGRVQRLGKAFEPIGSARSEVDVLLELAGRLGVKPGFNTLEGIQRKLAEELPGFRQLTDANPVPASRVSKEAAPR